MPIIPAQPQPEPKDTLSLRLDCVLHERLKQYCEFIQSPRDYVIGQALQQLFRKDREFAAWSESATKGQTPVATSNTSGAVPAAAQAAPGGRTEKGA
jgi:predicted transcriptional regulator